MPPTKRLFDILVASLLCVILFLPAIFVAAIVSCTSSGGVFYRHQRVGMDGRLFNLYKFRTMYKYAPELVYTGPFTKVVGDDRVTAVGAWLRRWSIDEIPQLVNVLNGTMSLVGPRPQVEQEVAFYPEVARDRLSVKPGLTGLWQISGRSDLTWQEGLALDLEYVYTHTILTDLTILAKTAGAVLTKSGAY